MFFVAPRDDAAPRALVVDDAMMRAVTCAGVRALRLRAAGDPRLDRAIRRDIFLLVGIVRRCSSGGGWW